MNVSDWQPKDWPLPDAMLIELGRVVAIWGALEGALDVAVGKLAGFDEVFDARPFILLRHSSFPQKVDMFSALCSSLKEQFPNLSRYKEVVQSIKDAQQERNKLMHNALIYEPENSEYKIAIGSARGKVKTDVFRISPEDVLKTTAKCHIAMLNLHELVTGKKYPPTWERRSL